MTTAIASATDLPRRNAGLWPDAPAMWFSGRTTTYAELDRLSSRCANALIAAGVRPQDRVGVLAKGCDDFFILWLGCLKARACLAPVNWRLAPPEVEFILRDAGVRLLFCGAEYAGLVTGLKDRVDALDQVVQFEPGSPDWPDFRAWIAAADDADPQLPAQADDDVIQLYTSGTTGLPKGVQLTQANYLALFESASQSWAPVSPGESVLVAMPLFHVAGANFGMLSFLGGGRAVILPEADPGAILRLMGDQKLVHAFLVPALINMLLQHPDLAGADFSTLRRVYYGASPISEEVLNRARAAFGAGFVQLYGLTETIGAGAWMSPEAHDPALGKLRACGRPSPGFEIRVRTAGRDAAPHEVGEIEIRSAGVMKGYWNRPEATAEAIDAQGWFRSGDAGYFDEDGFLFIHDRVKDMIVSGGENVYPAEVENALFSHPDVADAAVIGVPDEKWGEAVKAMVVLRPGCEPDTASIISHCRGLIAGYKVPKTVDFVPLLPRNPSGKVLRRELRAPYWEGRARQVS